MKESRHPITRAIVAASKGDSGASAEVVVLVYEELRKLARSRIARARPGHLLQPTALVHEAYLRLVDVGQAQRWDSRGHFFSAAAEAMRRILVEMARRKKRAKHGGDMRRVDLDAACTLSDAPSDDIVALDEALDRFCAVEPGKAELVKLRFFAGMTIPEAAKALGISHATAERYWTYARVWLYCELHEDSMAEEESKKIVGQ